MTPHDKVVIIRERMLEDYHNGFLQDFLKPYFEWKTGVRELESISRKEANDMMERVSNLIDELYDKHPHPFEGISSFTDDNPWQNYEGFGEDKYMMSYLEAIDYELTNLWNGGFF